MDDYFAVFGLPRRLRIDAAALRARFYELSRRHHPDVHQAAPEAARAEALDRAARLTRAYRALRDPLARLEYLIALEDGTAGGGNGRRPAAPRELLEEMLEVQEALEEAQEGGPLDPAAADRLRRERDRLRARRAAEEAAIAARAEDWDAAMDAGADGRPLLEWFKQRLATRAYLGTVIDDLTRALGEDEHGHGTDRRH
jgi:molecular chaperone HscB